MNKVSTYTSTGIKLMHHPDVVDKIIREKKGTPVYMEIAPTSACNLRCEFCSNINRTKDESLDLLDIVKFVSDLKKIGLKAVAFTGGGDPTMYPGIDSLIMQCYGMGLKVGLITNGIKLKDIDQSALDVLSWVRISMNCLDYVKHIDIPNIKGTLGFSYVWNNKTSHKVLEELHFHVKGYRPSYVRIVPNCQATKEEQKENNKKLAEIVEELGHPYFYQAKEFGTPPECFWGYMKPFLLHDGWVYPCSSVVLNDNAERCFHKKFRLRHMNDFVGLYQHEMKSFPTANCTHCVFTAQNNMVKGLVDGNVMKDFI